MPLSKFSTSSISSSLFSDFIDFLCQSCKHINASTTLGVKELLYASKIHPPILKADSDATMDIGTAKISRAMCERIGNLAVFSFHQSEMLKSSESSCKTSSKYTSTSLLLSLPCPPSIFCFFRNSFLNIPFGFLPDLTRFPSLDSEEVNGTSFETFQSGKIIFLYSPNNSKSASFTLLNNPVPLPSP